MAKPKRDMSGLELVFQNDRNEVERILGRELSDELEQYLHFEKFLTGIRQYYIDDTLPGLQALLLEQYPLSASFSDPVALAYIKETHELNASGLIWKCWKMIGNMNKGIDVLANNPKLEDWRAFYCNPQEPEVIGPDMVHVFPGDSEETIRQRVDKENAEIRKWHEQEKHRKDAYYDLMQPLLFKHMPTLQDLEGDYWVLYAVTIGDAYEEWKSLCEEMETTIEHGMPQESITYEYADWIALLNETRKKKQR